MPYRYNLTQIAEILGAQLKGGLLASAATQPQISYLLTDSRSLTFADQTLFFALITQKGDGHCYIGSLYGQGIRAFVISRADGPFYKLCPEAWFLVVPDTLSALQKLATFHRKRFSIPVVGITGSNGKTTVKEWLYQLLHDYKNIVRSPRSYNSQIGVPLSVWQLNQDCNLAIFEAGISLPGEMAKLESIIAPTIGILTNIGEAHQENFSGRMQKLVEKLLLFKNCDVIIYNADIPHIAEALELAGIGARSMAWTLKHKDAQIEILSVKHLGRKRLVRYMFMGIIDGEFTLPMCDEAGLENALNCLALMLYLNIPREEIQVRMEMLEPIAMRMEVVEAVRDCLVINDVYNSDLRSFEIALDFQKRRESSTLRNSLILSDIQESGLTPESLCRKVADFCRIYPFYRFIAIGQVLSAHRKIFDSVAEKTYFYESTEDFLQSDVLQEFSNELILLKGARRFRFEQISDRLQLRRHETVLEINLDSIVHNLNRYRSHLRPETKIVCMVKAFGYGNGSYELAKTLQDQHVDYLAVAVADEGAELRRQGIRVPIMVMNPEQSAFRTIITHRLEPEIYSFRLLEAFVRECEKMGVMQYPVHIKIDSGMHRLGFLPDEMEALISALQQRHTVCVRSVFSHFAGADSSEFDEFTEEQVKRFLYCADRICAAFPHKILRHILNSAGIERFPQYQFEMCRLGIGLYGIEASDQIMGLRSVSILKSTILQIKEVPSSETVGYSRRGHLARPSRIAMVPIGYADGYDRRLGNGRASMIVAGKRCPTVGNVCMDVAFLDVTDCADAQEGSEVIIWGEGLPVNELSDILETIPYEIISTVSMRVKRLYYKE